MMLRSPPPGRKVKLLWLSPTRERISSGTPHRNEVNLALNPRMCKGMTATDPSTAPRVKKNKIMLLQKGFQIQVTHRGGFDHASSDASGQRMAVRIPICAYNHHVACWQALQQSPKFLQKKPSEFFLLRVRVAALDPLIAGYNIQGNFGIDTPHM